MTIDARSIGSGKTYSTVALWEADAPANLVTSTTVWKGEVYGEIVVTAAQDIGGSTSSATYYKWLTAAAGESFADNANKLTNALRYNASNGAGLRNTYPYSTLMELAEDYARVDRMQLSIVDNGGSGLRLSNTGTVAFGCVIRGSGAATTILRNSGAKMINCAIITKANTPAMNANYGAGELRNCTFIKTGTAETSIGIYNPSGTVVVKNCAVFNFNTAFSGTAGSGSGYNATDSASTYGSNCVTSLTSTNELESFTEGSEDLRAKAGNHLVAGTPDSANTNDVDIVGQTRSGTTPTIGCWEVVTAAATSYAPPRGRTRNNFSSYMR